MQNAGLSMTKAQYFEMCEMLGSEPLDEEVPVDFEDLPQEVQECFQIYYNLLDNWDYMGGNYIGKELGSIFQLFDVIYEIPKEDVKWHYEMLLYIDDLRRKDIQSKKAKNQESQKPA